MADNVTPTSKEARVTGRRRRIYLMRHSQAEYYTPAAVRNHPDDAQLTTTGRDQADAAGQLLADVDFDRVVTSGLSRTVDTARIVLGRAKGPDPENFEVCPDLREIRSGPVDDVPLEVLEHAFLGIWFGVAKPESSFLGGESIASLVERVTSAFDALLDEPGWTTMLVVGHGAVNRAILSYALTNDYVFLGHIEQDTACVNVIDAAPHGHSRGASPRGLAVRVVNLTPYDLLHEGDRGTEIERMYAQYRETLRLRDQSPRGD